ncbi:dynamin-1-like [Oppia nitens]|uniref:dynamin-1-like n=1 Tax=Oppia nitens TaxID=1686743 RepID=UPI0023DBFE63|nr:dynamin-1-like [Oppia nitens]
MSYSKPVNNKTNNNNNNLVGNLIHIVNDLQDKLNPLGVKSLSLDLPQIVVIGGQSSGKSSVLENIVGQDFLPRGSGIVTRRPLVLQLIKNNSSDEVYGIFSHQPNKRYNEFHKIRDEIVRDTDKVVSSSVGISDKPIKLKIYSPKLLDLSLVDLPGIARVPVGDQPQDIEKLTKDLSLKYISNENSLILAVTAANQDLAVSDALTLARQVDPEGNRTIGVLTKLDLTDDKAMARQILTGKHQINLKRGFIGVINRSQAEIDDDTDIDSALEKERQFFRREEQFRDMADRMGIPYLHQELQRVLKRHIAQRLPPLMDQFDSRVHEINEQLDRMQTPIEDKDKSEILSKSIKQFEREFEIVVGGKRWETVNNKLSRGVKINRLMNDKYARDIESHVYNEQEMRRDIVVAIENTFGARTGLFVSDPPFIQCVRTQIDRYTRPSIDCVEWVTEELKLIVRDCLNKIDRYPQMASIFLEETLDFICKANRECKNYVRHFIDEEKIMNVNNDDFVQMTRSDVLTLISVQKTKPGQNNNNQQQTTMVNGNNSAYVGDGADTISDLGLDQCSNYMDSQIDEVKSKVDSYILILKKTFKDRLPKICILELIDQTTDFISTRLSDQIRDKYQTIDDILGRDANEELRRDLETQHKQYKEAIDIINKCQHTA